MQSRSRWPFSFSIISQWTSAWISLIWSGTFVWKASNTSTMTTLSHLSATRVISSFWWPDWPSSQPSLLDRALLSSKRCLKCWRWSTYSPSLSVVLYSSHFYSNLQACLQRRGSRFFTQSLSKHSWLWSFSILSHFCLHLGYIRYLNRYRSFSSGGKTNRNYREGITIVTNRGCSDKDLKKMRFQSLRWQKY